MSLIDWLEGVRWIIGSADPSLKFLTKKKLKQEKKVS